MHPNEASSQDDLAERYRNALAALDALCGLEFESVRLIVQHLDAVANQKAINQGLPEGKEACSVEGLRLQLRRLVAEERICREHGVVHQISLAMAEVEAKWVKRLAPLVSYRFKLSYNDSYFGEPAGLLKHVLSECRPPEGELARLLQSPNPKQD